MAQLVYLVVRVAASPGVRLTVVLVGRRLEYPFFPLGKERKGTSPCVRKDNKRSFRNWPPSC
jgi:hypothetical protein